MPKLNARQDIGVALGLALAALVSTGAAGSEDTPSGKEATRLRPVVGETRSALVLDGETLLDVAFRHRVGFQALRRLNPDVDVWIPDPGTIVRLPSRMILPDADPEGLVVNIPEMRLYDFTAGPKPEILAVAVGDAEDPTPIGDFAIGRKRVDPAWNVPESIRQEKPKLPERVPPGPDNPLGSRWLTIGTSSYGLHGTNIRWSIGREATHGCVRLYEEDVRRLFERVPEGTRLQLVYQPFKWGRDGSRIYFEAHPDLYGRVSDPLAAALSTPRALGLLPGIDIERVWRAIEAANGVPVPVGTLPDPPPAGDEASTSSPSS